MGAVDCVEIGERKTHFSLAGCPNSAMEAFEDECSASAMYRTVDSRTGAFEAPRAASTQDS